MNLEISEKMYITMKTEKHTCEFTEFSFYHCQIAFYLCMEFTIFFSPFYNRNHGADEIVLKNEKQAGFIVST